MVSPPMRVRGHGHNRYSSRKILADFILNAWPSSHEYSRSAGEIFAGFCLAN